MKIIGIIGRAYENKDKERIIQVKEEMLQALASYDEVVPILLLPPNNISNTLDKEKVTHILKKCHGFIVPGGTNWSQFDEYVINYAVDTDIPLLAICAGFQALCSLDATSRTKFDMSKKLENDSHYKKEKDYHHMIKIKDNTILKQIIPKDYIPVNSLHHDYINFSFQHLKVCALSSDNVIEAVFWPHKKFILGLQWHPEYLMDSYSQKIIDTFVSTL